MASSEASGPMLLKFQVEPPWSRGRKDCKNGRGPLTKMTPFTYMVKTFSSPEPNKPWGLIFAQITNHGQEVYQITTLMFDHKVTFASPCICISPIHLYGKNIENSYFGHLLYNPIELKLDDEHKGT